MKAPKQQLKFALTASRPLVRRHGLKMLLAMVMTGLFVWLWLATAQFLPVKKIAVTGELEQVTGATLQEVVVPLVADGFVRMDVDEIRDRIEAMPWVKQATIRRSWPDTLAVEVVEQQVLAYWDKGALVNSEGELFYPENAASISNVPVFKGVDNLSKAMTERFNLYSELLALTSHGIAQLAVNERRAWSIQLDNGIELVLGREQGEAALTRFARAYKEALASQANEIARVDLRYTNGFAVRLKTKKMG